MIEKIIKKIALYFKGVKADRNYYLAGRSCFSLFPPSFYITHTPEEAERIKKETIEELLKLLEEFDE